jgi:hypothetical protein
MPGRRHQHAAGQAAAAGTPGRPGPLPGATCGRPGPGRRIFGNEAAWSGAMDAAIRGGEED